MWGYFFFGKFGVNVITACTSCSLRLYFSEALLVLPRDYGIIFFPTFGFYRFSCTSYIKWVYFFCRMVVLMSVKYLTVTPDDLVLLGKWVCTSQRSFTKVFSKMAIIFSYGVRLWSMTTQNVQHKIWTSRDMFLYFMAFLVVLLGNVSILLCFTITKHVCFRMIILDCPYTLFKWFWTFRILNFELPNISMWTYVGILSSDTL
jgi:hypothetical protein